MYAFNPHDLFPSQGSKSSTTSPLLPCSKGIALTGSLPISSLLHLSFSHLQHGSLTNSNTSRGFKGKGREEKEKKVERHVMIISPDRGKLQEALVEENEQTLREMRCEGESIKLLERIEFKYLPTTAHLRYFLMTLYTSDSPSTAYEAYVASGAPVNGKLNRNDPSYLPKIPTLVILHDLSLYLAEEENQKAGLESYASLLALFTSTFSNLSPSQSSKPPFLILHDRHSSNTRIPILASHLRIKKTRKRSPTNQGEEGSDEDMAREWGEDEDEGGMEGERIEVERIGECFFDWVGKVARSERDLASELEGYSNFALTMRRSTRINSAETNRADSNLKEVKVEFMVERSQVFEEAVSIRIAIVES